jgi:hypothetical protein
MKKRNEHENQNRIDRLAATVPFDPSQFRSILFACCTQEDPD